MKSRFDTVPKKPNVEMNLIGPVAEQKTDVQWKQVEDDRNTEVVIGKVECVAHEEHVEFFSTTVTSPVDEDTHSISGPATIVDTVNEEDVHDAASGANVINSSTLQVQDISGPGTANTANEEEVCDAASGANVIDSSTLQVKGSSVVHDAISSENQVVEDKWQSTQVTASEALAFLCNSEADTQNNDDGLASNVMNTETNAKEQSSGDKMKKTDEDDGQSMDVFGNPSTFPAESEDANKRVDGDQIETVEDDANHNVVHDGEELKNNNEIMNLQEGMKKMDVNNDDEFVPEAEDDRSTDNDLLGSEVELSKVDDEDEKLLVANPKMAGNVDENSSSGSSAFYGFDGNGNAVQETGNELPHYAEGQEPNYDDGELLMNNSTDVPSKPSIEDGDVHGHEDASQMEEQGKLPSFRSTFRKAETCSKKSAACAGHIDVLPKQPVVHMQTIIHSLGTNPEMQMVMKGRLPSTSGSEADVPEVIEKVMMSRMTNMQSPSMLTSTQSALRVKGSQHKSQEVMQHSGALKGDSAAASASHSKSIS